MTDVLGEIAALRSNRNAFEEWSEYRRQLTDIVIAGTEEGDTLAVYGTGACNDIDLGRLAEHFSEITLLDFNEEAMHEALKRYQLVEAEKIRTECVDFVGISENDYERLAERMREALDSGVDIAGQLRPVIETFYTRLPDSIFRAPRYDVVLAAGLHSQLNQTAVSIWRILCDERGIETDPLHDPVASLLHVHTYPIIVRFNQLLFYSAKKKVFIAYEEGIEGREGHVQGAMQLQDDLKRRVQQRQVRLVQRHEARWPQNRMRGMIFRMAIDEYA